MLDHTTVLSANSNAIDSTLQLPIRHTACTVPHIPSLLSTTSHTISMPIPRYLSGKLMAYLLS
jgi:hypothetical protein